MGPGIVAPANWEVAVANNTVGAHPGLEVALVKVRLTISDSVGGDRTSTWVIRNLSPGHSEALIVASVLPPNRQVQVPQRLYAEIIESVPSESPRFRFNNATEHWALVSNVRRAAAGDIDVALRGISGRFPQPGEATTVTVELEKRHHNIPQRTSIEESSSLFDVEVEISLSAGLSFAATQPEAATGTTFATTTASTGTWDVGAMASSIPRILLSLPVVVNLTADSLAELPLEERCMTAEVSYVPRFLSRQQNDTATACLGRSVLLSSGEIDLFTFYPCIGVTSHPCTDADTLELVVSRGTSEHISPDSVIVQVPDPGGRFTSTRHGRVIWSTANLMDLRDSQTRLTSGWSIKESVKVTALGGGNAPGRWLLTDLDDSAQTFDLLDAMSSSTVAQEFFDLSEIGTDPADYFVDVKVDLWEMGTYEALFGISGRLSGTTYTDTGTYIFHVGPIAELEVHDAGANPEVAADQRAYTILAVNNGPDDAPAVRVTGLPAGVTEYFASVGEYDPASGVWTIGELRPGYAHRPSAYGAEGVALTLVTDDPAAPDINATIENTQDYQVCIDSSGDDVVLSSPSETACTNASSTNAWHSIAYYDHVPGNNTATITAITGTGVGLTGAPGGVKVTETPVANILTWQPVESVYGHPVTRYEVQRATSTWVTLDSDVKGTVYEDMAPQTDHPDYRVRAVNEFGVPGPWSAAGRRPGVPKSFTASGSSDTRAALSWGAPDAVSGVTVTGYELDFSTDGGNAWNWLPTGATRTVLSASTLSHPHTDTTLAADAVRQYRLRTVGTVSGVTVRSGYTYAVATRDYPTPGAPRNFLASAISQSQVNLSWSPPESVSGVSITGYDLEFSTDGAMWTSLAQERTDTTFPHTNTALAAGVIRQYRLRAVGEDSNNAVFRSGWVFASAATQEVGPPRNLSATAYGSGRIDLAWNEPAFGASLVTGYRIDHTPASPEQWRTLEHGYRSSPRSYEHAGLSPGQRYCYRVAAVYAGGTGPFSARGCATTDVAPTHLPGEPRNLRVSRVGSDFVTLEWDAPSEGGDVEYYEYQSNAHAPTVVSPRTATRVTVRGLLTGSSYDFQVRAGNADHGRGQWSGSVYAALSQAGSALVASPLKLDVARGGSGSFKVRLNRSPQWPLLVYFHWDGPECLTGGLVYQQGKILLPSSPKPSRAFWSDGWWGPPEDRHAAAWNAGVDIRVDVPADASACRAGATAVVQYSVSSLPFSYIEGVPMWDELGLDLERWRGMWGIDPLDAASGPSIKLTVVDPDP